VVLDRGDILNAQGPPLIWCIRDIEYHRDVFLYILDLTLSGVLILVMRFCASIGDTKVAIDFLGPISVLLHCR
jgi:hypothetical protein